MAVEEQIKFLTGFIVTTLSRFSASLLYRHLTLICTHIPQSMQIKEGARSKLSQLRHVTNDNSPCHDTARPNLSLKFSRTVKKCSFESILREVRRIIYQPDKPQVLMCRRPICMALGRRQSEVHSPTTLMTMPMSTFERQTEPHDAEYEHRSTRSCNVHC